MALPILLAGMLAKKFAPKLIGLLGGKKAESVAENILGVAGSVLGISDPNEIIKTVDQGLTSEQNAALQSRMIDLQATELEEETKRLQTINETYRKEIDSNDPYIARWRPTFGYCVAFSWAALIAGMMITIIVAVWKESDIPAIITSLSSFVTALMPLYGIALAVLGVSVVKRSDDKQTAAGGTPSAIFDIFKKNK